MSNRVEYPSIGAGLAKGNASKRENCWLNKSVFTTGEVAAVCRFSRQTATRCFDRGKLRGFRVPGSRFRRIPRESLILFMKKNRIPLDQIETVRKRVLIVDDDHACVEMLVKLLEWDGRFEARSATTGFEAGFRIKEFRPEVIVLNSAIDANEICRTIREDSTLGEIKIIIVSAVVDRVDVKRLLDNGADDFLQKPFSAHQLIALMISTPQSVSPRNSRTAETLVS